MADELCAGGGQKPTAPSKPRLVGRGRERTVVDEGEGSCPVCGARFRGHDAHLIVSEHHPLPAPDAP